MNEYIEMMKAQGWQVYTRKPLFGKLMYCYVTDGTHIAYVQWQDDPGVSTVHIPNKTTGTGFHFADTITPETIQGAMNATAPAWANAHDRASVKKYKDWEHFHKSDSWHGELREVAA